MKASRLGFLSVALVLGLAACNEIIPGPDNGGPDAGPAINSFTANPSVISAGQTSTLTWDVDSSATSISISPDVGDVTGETSTTVSPDATTEYTLTAEGADGTSQATTTVTVNDGGSGGVGPDPIVDPGDPTSAPTGTFGVSTSESGPFTSDADGSIQDNSDERIITVSAGDTFYAQVAYADSDGIADITLLLVNSEPAGLSGPLGTTPRGGFTVGEPTGDCELDSSPTEVTCIYPITVEAGTPDIEELEGAGDEFAYVFRVTVADTAGNVAGITDLSDRGYVNIE